MYDSDDLCADMAALIADGLIAATGPADDPRFILTPDGERALSAAEDHEAAVRHEARELAERRHASARDGRVIYLPLSGA